jgi:hypothetical protein
MNRGLLGFSILLIFIGFVSGYYAISLLGIFLFFPAILTTPRSKTQRAPVSTSQPPRRIAPREVPPVPQFTPAQPEAAKPAPPTPLPASQPQANYSPSLFPNPMFPSFSQPLTGQQPPAEKKDQPQGSRDELLEAGALLTLLKLALG